MPTYKVEAPQKQKDVVPKSQLVRIKAESTKLVPEIVARAEDMVIITKDQYALCDADLQRVTEAEKKITLKFRGTEKAPGPITTIYSGLAQLYALERELLKPLEATRKFLTGKMAAWKLEERRQLQASQAALDAEAARLRELARQKEQKAVTARTAPLRERYEAEAAEMLEQADVTLELEEQPIKVVGSTDRFVDAVRVTDMKKLAAGIACGVVPQDVIIISQGTLNKYLKADAETVKLWADYGVEVYDACTIVRK